MAPELRPFKKNLAQHMYFCFQYQVLFSFVPQRIAVMRDKSSCKDKLKHFPPIFPQIPMQYNTMTQELPKPRYNHIIAMHYTCNAPVWIKYKHLFQQINSTSGRIWKSSRERLLWELRELSNISSSIITS